MRNPISKSHAGITKAAFWGDTPTAKHAGGSLPGDRNRLRINILHYGGIAWLAAVHILTVVALFFSSWKNLLIAVVCSAVIKCVGNCLGYHRYFSHKSFETSRPVAYVLAVIGCLAGQGGPIGWAATHRHHHAHTDTAEDVHSPIRGFFWAHAGWMLSPETIHNRLDRALPKLVPDLLADPGIVLINRFHGLPLAVLGFALYAFGGWPAVLWGVFVSTFIGHHASWFVNSAAHTWGYRSFETNDRSTNNAWVALLTFGEGWHNNHHACPGAARHGLKWWEIDPTYGAIRVLSRLGLAWNLRGRPAEV